MDNNELLTVLRLSQIKLLLAPILKSYNPEPEGTFFEDMKLQRGKEKNVLEVLKGDDELFVCKFKNGRFHLWKEGFTNIRERLDVLEDLYYAVC